MTRRRFEMSFWPISYITQSSLRGPPIFYSTDGIVLRDKIHTLQWRHNDHDSVSNHQPHDCLLNRLFGCRSYQSKHQSSASLAFVRWNQRGRVNSPHKWPVTRKMFPFDDVIMQMAYKSWKPSEAFMCQWKCLRWIRKYLFGTKISPRTKLTWEQIQ